MTLPPYEKLGSFYLGREVDSATGQDRPQPLLYDSRDLTTHAVCVGMTGSGKTGLCMALLEEAAIDGVPSIVIDPKGDLGNLLLSFPKLETRDFAPWVDPQEAARKGMTIDAFAESTAETWRKGLAEWDQDGARIERFRQAVEIALYTPGNEAGRPLSVLRSFAAPAAELRSDTVGMRERIGATVAGLLGLVNIDADPLKSREHILLATLIDRAWREGRDLDLPAIIQGIQKPPFDTVGVLDLETFYPAKDRLTLAMALNGLIAAPSFAAWLHGEPLDPQRLLFTADGRPRIAIISIAHLGDAERMFIVTLLLGEVVAWMRRQPGTSSLRALLYMDEIFGYFPPSAMPPSKGPLLTLMKQARAFGLGVVLATQNPVDLDYKGLANAGTWFIGRLQTERDKARVIDGLIGSTGEGLDKARLERLIANLGSRVFLMRNVHDEAPVLFRSRWVLSYMRGPMTLQEIARIRPQREEFTPATTNTGAAGTASGLSPPPAPRATKPVVPAGVAEAYLGVTSGAVLMPHVLATARLHFLDRPSGLDVWHTRSWLAPLQEERENPDWARAKIFNDDLHTQVAADPPAQALYGPVPATALRARSYDTWRKDLAAHIYESQTLEAFRCPLAGLRVAPAENEAEFRSHIALALREKRDAEVDRLRKKYADRIAKLEDRLRRADERISRERSQLSQQKMQTAISVGTSILGALLGRKAVSATNVGRVGSAARSAGRIGRESEDVNLAVQNHATLEQQLDELREELEREIDRLQSELDPMTVSVERVDIKPRKTDINVSTVSLVWTPA